MDLQAYYRQKRRAVIIRKIILASAVFGLSAGLIWGFFQLPFLRISKVEVSEYSDIAAIKNAVSPYLNNYFLFSEAIVEQALRGKGFGIAKITKKFPKTVIVEFPKPEPWLIYCREAGTCFYIDESGVVSDYAPRFSQNPLPEIVFISRTLSLGDSAFGEKEFVFLKTALLSLKGLESNATKIEAGDKELKIFLKEEWFLYLDPALPPQKVFGDLKILFDEKIKDRAADLEYIDMRFENKAFYKFRPG